MKSISYESFLLSQTALACPKNVGMGPFSQVMVQSW